MYADRQKEPTVITYPELAGIIMLTAVLMVLIFPKQNIEKAIREESSNYDLTLIYLRSIAEAYPDNPDNWLRLIDAQLRMGETEAAGKVFTKLSKTPALDKIYLDLLSFRLIRTRYEKSKDPATKARLKAVLHKRLAQFVASSDPTLWYTALHEAQRIQLPEIAFQALQKRITHSVLIDPKEVKEGFFLGLSLGKKREAEALLAKALAHHPDPQLYRLLRDHYLGEKAYAEAGETALACYTKRHDPDCLLDAVRYLFSAQRDKEAVALLKRYETDYLTDSDISEKIIKLWLANNRLQEAHDFTLRLMKRQKVLP